MALPAPSCANGPDYKHEPELNSQMFPKRILATGVRLDVSGLSPNSIQLAGNIGLTAVLDRIRTLKQRLDAMSAGLSPSESAALERLTLRQDLNDAVQEASLITQRCGLEIDFTLAEIASEVSVYREWLAACLLKRKKVLNATVIASGTSNLLLWAACEALTLPIVKHPSFTVPSGLVGISAGVVPSVASMYALKASGGSKYTSEKDPNMLAKLFDTAYGAETEYPQSVWEFLSQVPASEKSGRTRRQQLIDRWISDASIPTFTSRYSQRQLEILSASGAHPDGLSINTLNMRVVMLEQLSAEVKKMKRNLLELVMVLQGEKSFAAAGPAGSGGEADRQKP